MCPATPSSNPKREKSRNAAASIRLRCVRSSAAVANLGGRGMFNTFAGAPGIWTSVPRIEWLIPVDLLSGGGLLNKSCDSTGLRYVDGVAALDLNDRRTGPLGHGTLGLRWDHLVLGGDQVPARLGSPRRFADRAANGPHAPRDLGIGHELSFFCLYVGRERGGELRLVEKQKAVLRG